MHISEKSRTFVIEKRKRNNQQNHKAMYETKDDIPEAIWEYVEAFFENDQTETTKEIKDYGNNEEKTPLR